MASKPSAWASILLKNFESVETKAYPDPASALGRACSSRGLKMRDYKMVPAWESLSGHPWTIGVGETGPEIHEGLEWTEAQCMDRLAARLSAIGSRVQELTAGVELTQGQFDALCCFAFNVGLERLKDSTLLRRVKNGDIEGAAQEFLRWDVAQGHVMPGLLKRRMAERRLFLGQI